MNVFELRGLDAQNPLAFLAALGLLRVVDADARRREGERPRLAFVDVGQQMPVLDAETSLDDLYRVVLEDAESEGGNPVLGLAYDDEGRRVTPDTPKSTPDLKPPPAIAQEILVEAAEAGGEAAALAAACFSELVQDNNGKTKPTAFHFTAGQQVFLAMVNELRTGLLPEHLDEALFGPWQGKSTLPSLSWDSTAARFYALRAGDPSKEKRGSVAGANWLAVRALPFFPVVVQRRRLATTCVEGTWNESVFRWPTWSPAATVVTVASLLRLDVASLSTAAREAVGVAQVFESRILRIGQGYGAFTPAAVVLPPFVS